MSYIDSYPTQDSHRTGYAGNLTEQQQAVFDELMASIEKCEYFADLNKLPHPDWFVLRFLRATMKEKIGQRIFLAAPAEKRFLATMQWRRKMNTEKIRENLRFGTCPPEYVQFANDIVPKLVWQDTKTGRPCALQKLGLVAQYLKTDCFTMEQWEMCFTYDLERLLMLLDDHSAARGIEIGTTVSIFDLQGLGLGSLTRIKLLRVLDDITSSHYPEISGPIFVMQAPWTFAKIFALVQPILDADTQSKIVVSNKFDLGLLSRVLGDDVRKFLPIEYDGTNTEPYKHCIHAPQ